MEKSLRTGQKNNSGGQLRSNAGTISLQMSAKKEMYQLFLHRVFCPCIRSQLQFRLASLLADMEL